MRRILVFLAIACLLLGAAASVFADGTEEVKPPAQPESAAPQPAQPEAKALGPAKRPSASMSNLVRVRGRNHARALGPMQGVRCPLCGNAAQWDARRAQQALAVLAKVTGIPVEELKKSLSDGVGFGEICGAAVVARKQGKSFSDVLKQAKADKVDMRASAYAAGISMDQYAAEVKALHIAFLKQAVADGLVSKEKAQQALQALQAPGAPAGLRLMPGLRHSRMPGFGSAGAGMLRFARARGMILRRWQNMIRGGAGSPGPVK